MTTTLATERRTGWNVGLALGSLTGATLLVAGVWNALVQEHVTISGPPTAPADATPEQAMRPYYAWYADTVGQQRAVTIVAMVGVGSLLLLADALRRKESVQTGLTRAGATALGAGSLVWLTGALVEVGTHRAVGLMGTHGNEIQGVNSIAFTADLTVQAFSAAAFLLWGLALVAVGVATVRGAPARWAGLSVGTGACAVLVAVGYLRDVDFLTTYVLGLVAAVLMPVWAVWTGRLMDRDTEC